MKGKQKCKILREIRRKIAEENDIALISKDCAYQGECRGTCPKCEAELHFLEQELEKRRRLGKAVTVAALAASLTVGLTACVPQPLAGDVAAEVTENSLSQTVGRIPDTEPESDPVGQLLETAAAGTIVQIKGELPTETDCEPIMGYFMPFETEGSDIVELEGDVAYIPETTDAP